MTQKLTRETRLRRQRRLVRVPVDMELLALTILQPKKAYRLKLADEVPEDSVFMTAFYDYSSQDAFFVFGHELFEKVAEGTQLPIKNCAMEMVAEQDDFYDGY